MRALVYIVNVDSMFHQTGTIVVSTRPLPQPDFELKEYREVSRGFFPLLGVVSSGSYRTFYSWEELWDEFEIDGFKLAVE